LRVWTIGDAPLAAALSHSDSGIPNCAASAAASTEHCSMVALHRLHCHTAPVSCVALSASLDICLSGAHNGQIAVHRVTRGRHVRSFFLTRVTDSDTTIVTTGTADERRSSCSGSSGTSSGRRKTAEVATAVAAAGAAAAAAPLVARVAAVSEHGDLVLHCWTDISLHVYSLNGAPLAHTVCTARVTCLACTADGTMLVS
jgi:hypothetical protein